MWYKNNRNLIFAGISLLMVSVIFVSGFYIGSHSDQAFINSQVKAGEPVDLESFWKVWHILDQKFVSASSTLEISSEERLYGAIEGMVGSLKDPYTVFLPPAEKENFDESINGNFSGVGMEVSIKNDLLTVVSPLKDSPAERAGILSGDIVLMVNGESTLNMTIDEAISRIRGERGTEVTLTIARDEEDETFDVVIVRDNIKIPTVDTENLGDGIFSISLYNFNANSTSDFRGALREFVISGNKKLILDLRGNPGGFLDASIDIASWFLPAGKVIVKEDFGENKEEKVFRSKGYNIIDNSFRMVVLVDGGSASASEIVAGALQDHNIATLIGKNTFGKGSVQELLDITDNTSLKVTVARWLTPSGKSISDGGLKPDIESEITSEDIRNGDDPQLERAIRYLKHNE